MIYCIQTIACSVIFYIAFHFLFKDKNEHAFNRFYLLSSLLLAMIIPLCHIPVFPEYINVISTGKPMNNIAKEVVQASYSFTWKDALLMFYILGILIHGVLFTIRLSKIGKVVKSGKRELKNGIIHIVTAEDIPVSSFLSYLFIPKENEKSITAYELYHEGIHIRQKHSWDILFLEILRIIFWFNPFIILYKKRLVEIHEFLADEYSSKVFGQEEYEQFLALKTYSSPKQQQQLIHNFYTLFEKRIKMMNSNVSTKKWQYGLVLPIIAMVLMAFSFENYPVYKVQEGNLITNNELDSFPPIPPELEGQEIDTIISFDPDTYKEMITYQLSTGETPISQATENPLIGIDTIVVFDPVDFSETIIIMNHDTGQIDTIR